MFKINTIKKTLGPRQWLALGILLLLIFFSLWRPLFAETVTKGYDSDKVMVKGTIASLKAGDADKVEPSNLSSSLRLAGVVVDKNEVPVTLASDSQKVFVASSGQFETKVSDQNGGIKAGDYIAISGVDGVGMKADSEQPAIIGKALASFDSKNKAESTATVDVKNQPKTVNIGKILVDINIVANPLAPTNTPVPAFLKKATQNIAGRPVGVSKAYLSIAIFIISGIVSGSMLYGGVRSSITSIGRNPLSKKIIIRGLIQVILTSLIIFLFSLFAVYLLLKV